MNSQKWTFWRRLKFAWQAYKNAHRTKFGIPISVEYHIDGYLPSMFTEIAENIVITYLNENGNIMQKDLRI